MGFYLPDDVITTLAFIRLNIESLEVPPCNITCEGDECLEYERCPLIVKENILKELSALEEQYGG